MSLLDLVFGYYGVHVIVWMSRDLEFYPRGSSCTRENVLSNHGEITNQSTVTARRGS